jgi:NADH-quinone oxidoreductase subunit C
MTPAVAPATPDAGAESAAAVKSRFGTAVTRVWQSCGDSIVHVKRGQAHEAMAWLKTDPGQRFNYLVDITAVEYRDPERDLEVVYNLRSIERKAELRVKIELDKTAALEVDSVYDLWRGADWLEREVFDMFGVRFKGHPDLRRILMWETYAEGYPLRKDFPLRGHFSRAEQTRQALAANPEAHYSLEELSIVEAYGELPQDVRDRLEHGKRGMVE